MGEKGREYLAAGKYRGNILWKKKKQKHQKEKYY